MSTDTEPDYIVKPAEISAEETEGARQLVLHSFLTGLIVILMLNSASLVDLSRRLPFGPMRDTGEALAMTWNSRMESYGLNDFRDEIQRRVQALRDLRWEKEAEDGTDRDGLAARLRERIEHREI